MRISKLNYYWNSEKWFEMTLFPLFLSTWRFMKSELGFRNSGSSNYLESDWNQATSWVICGSNPMSICPRKIFLMTSQSIINYLSFISGSSQINQIIGGIKLESLPPLLNYERKWDVDFHLAIFTTRNHSD